MTDVSVRFKADTTELKKAEKSLDDLAKSGKQAAKASDELGESGKEASQKMTSGFGSAANSLKTLVAGYLTFQTAKSALTGVISTTAEFSQSIANLSAITGATGKDLEYYAKQAKEIGKTTSLSASQAAEGFKLIASAKPDLLASAESLAAVTREAVTLAEATGSSLPDAAAALGAALNQFQLPASDANRVINALAASSQLGTAEVTAVTEAMRNAGSAANSLGLDFEETVAGIQALAASGRQGADAGTALRQVLLRLEATADQTLQPSIVGLVGALETLKARNLDNTQLMDLFGQEAFTAATSLLAQSDVAAKLNVTLRGTQTATEQAAINMDTLQGDSLKARSAFEALQITIGERLEPRMRSLTQATTEAITSLDSFLKGMSNEDLIESLGMVIDENGKLVDSIEAAKSAAEKYQATLSETAIKSEKLGAVSKMVAGGGGLGGVASSMRQATIFTEKSEDALEEHVKAYYKSLEAQADIQKSIGKTIVQLEYENQSLQLTGRAQAIFNATTEAYVRGAGPEQIAIIAELTAKNYDLSEANKATGKAAEDAAKQAQENWQRTHEYMTDALIDIMDNGGNAFDNIAKSFEAMVKRMVAEWAASGLMKLFGLGGGGFSLPSIGGGGGGNAASTAGTVAKIGSAIFGGGGGASALPAAGASAAEWGAFYGGTGAGAGGFLSSVTGAASTAWSGITGALGSIPGWGWALAGTAIAAKMLDSGGTMSTNAGMLIRPVGDGERQFDVPAFASGFDPIGFARREDRAQAEQVIDVFRSDDAVLTSLAKAAGISVNYSADQFGGFDEKGRGNGLFFGQAGEDGRGTSVSIDDQRSQFVRQWLQGLSGQVDQALISDAISAGSADEMIKRAAKLAGVDGSHANGMDYVPFDGYRATVHRGEKIVSVAERVRESNNSERLAAEMAQMRRELNEQKVYNRRTFEILDRWAGSNFAVTT